MGEERERGNRKKMKKIENVRKKKEEEKMSKKQGQERKDNQTE